MKLIKLELIALMAMLTTGPLLGQTNLNFNGILTTVECATRLAWNSTSNEVYEIDEADALNTNFDGTPVWHRLYGGYPSQGTNTSWLDTGNYYVAPAMPHPKYVGPRSSRIVNHGTNDGPAPSV